MHICREMVANIVAANTYKTRVNVYYIHTFMQTYMHAQTQTHMNTHLCISFEIKNNNNNFK